MSFMSRIRETFARDEAVEQREANTIVLRDYKAIAGTGARLLGDMPSMSPVSGNYDIRAALTNLRAKGRYLVQNNDYAKKFIALVINNVIGSQGFSLQNKAKDDNGSFDVVANGLIEGAFRDWSKKGNCDVSGKYSFRQFQEMILKTVPRDGEVFVRIHKGSRYGAHGFCLQLIEPDMLDDMLTKSLPNGNIIFMGVEETAEGKPVNYYFKKFNAAQVSSMANITLSNEWVIVPASEIIHLYDAERVSQSRGVSWFASSVIRMQQLSGFEEASVVNARVSAAKMGFFKSNNGTDYSGEDVNEPFTMRVEPGVWEQLPAGLDIASYDPKFPSESHEAFIKTQLRGIASGLGVSYNTLANDLEGVNYSSIRAGLIDERENWKRLQSWFIESFLEVIFPQWLEMALVNGAVNLPFVKFDKFNKAEWTGKRWAWVDPMKDIQAQILAIDNGLKTRTQVIAEQGGDIEDVFSGLSEEKKLADGYGLSLGDVAAPVLDSNPVTVNK